MNFNRNTNLFFCFIFLLNVTFLYAQKGIKIEYDFIDENPEFLKASEETGNIVINFGYYALEGNNNRTRFYDVKDLRYENRMKQEQEENMPIKQMFVSSFYRGTFYADFDSKKTYQSKRLWNKDVLVKDTLKVLSWDLKREGKKVLNFDTKLAVYEDDDKIVKAWYSTQLPFKIGPLDYFNLPGTTLELVISYKDENNKSIHRLTATNVEISDDLDIEFPKKSKTFTIEEFQQKKDEAMERHKEMMGGGVDISD